MQFHWSLDPSTETLAQCRHLLCAPAQEWSAHLCCACSLNPRSSLSTATLRSVTAMQRLGVALQPVCKGCIFHIFCKF